MTCYVYSLGVNHYADQQINSLKCAENDARRVAAAFEFRYGCHSEYLEERSSEQIIDKISTLGQQLLAGDQFIFYFSGHGKVIADEQLLLLPGCKLQLLEEHHACLRWTTLKKITSSQQWQGVQSLFIIDACRLPLEANKGAGIAEFGDGLLLRDPIFVKPAPQTAPLSLSLLHSCAPGKSAAEIPALKAGIFTQAFLDLLKAGEKPPAVFDSPFAEQVAMRMQAIALERGVAGLQQQPVWVGKPMAMRASTVRVQAELAETTVDETPQAHLHTQPATNSEQKIQPQAAELLQHWKHFVVGGLALGLVAAYWYEPQLKKIMSEVAVTPATATLAPVSQASSLAVVVEPAATATPEASSPAAAPEVSNATEQNTLGDKYYEVKNYAEAVKWYRKAAEQGHAGAQANLGFMYRNDFGVKQDYVAAVEWYRKAAEQNDAHAQNNLGFMYQGGYGVRQNYVVAIDWYRRAAEQKHAAAQVNLGVMYRNGYGVKQDYATAVEWYRKAAEQNDATAQNNLGTMYRNGYGVRQDYATALEWYRKAAEQNNEDAQNNLGIMYELGQGVDKNPKLAREWYQKAAAQGHEQAKANLERLNRQ